MAINKTDFSSTQQVYDSTWTTPTKKTGPTTTDLPEQQRKLQSLLDDPQLEAPKGPWAQTSFVNLSTLSSEAIMSMLGFEERKSAVDSGMSEIETKRQQRAEINEERIENLKEQAEKAEKSGLLDQIKQVFSYIGMALSAIASIASIAAGVITGNPLLIAGGALMLLSTTEQIMSAATDGEISLANGFAQAAKATGGNEQAARIAGMVTSVLIGLTGAIMSGGASMGAAASQAGNIANSTITQAANTATTVTSIASGVANVGTGAVTIAKSVYDYELTNLKADMSDLQAILLRIQQAGDADTEQLKHIMEKSQQITEGVKALLDDCNQSLGAVLTGTPALA